MPQKPKQQTNPMESEVTGPQILSTSGTTGGVMIQQRQWTYEEIRKLRTHPTVALARALSVAPIIGGNWSVEADDGVPDEVKEFILKQFLALRPLIYETALLLGNIDFGWMPYEKVFNYDGRWIRLAKLKPLLHDITEILVDEISGTFMGLRQSNANTGQYDYLPTEKCLVVNFRCEGTEWYGVPLMENARRIARQWDEANDAAARYDKKLAGSFIKIRYPAGGKTYHNGVLLDNETVVRRLAADIEASGIIAVPSNTEKSGATDAESESAWDIVTDTAGGGQQSTFVDRLRYIDTLICRALIVPERAILEGQFGTKAEAGVQQDIALTWMELLDQHVTRIVNWHAVDQLLAMNFGEEARGTVRLVATPLADVDIAWFRQVYQAFLTNPQGFAQEYGEIDSKSLREKVKIPQQKATMVPSPLNQPGLTGDQIAQTQQSNVGLEPTGMGAIDAHTVPA